MRHKKEVKNGFYCFSCSNNERRRSTEREQCHWDLFHISSLHDVVEFWYQKFSFSLVVVEFFFQHNKRRNSCGFIISAVSHIPRKKKHCIIFIVARPQNTSLFMFVRSLISFADFLWLFCVAITWKKKTTNGETGYRNFVSFSYKLFLFVARIVNETN